MKSLVVPGTFSKDPSFWGVDFPVQEIQHGRGPNVFPKDGGPGMLDWVSGLGTNLLGYGHPLFTEHLIHFVRQGSGFSLPHYLEAKVAEQLAYVVGSHVPGWTPQSILVRWAKTGSDVTDMAIRLARASTGKFKLVSSGYHGWHDSFVALTPPAHGVLPEAKDYIQEIKWNDLDGLNSIDKRTKIACVIVEQGVEDPSSGWYPGLRKFCDERGAVFILDEVVTGFRYALGGAAEVYGAKPDLCCYGKALGNGMAVSALVGRSDLLQWFARDDPVFCSSTHWGESLGLAAAAFVLDYLTPTRVNHLWTTGDALIDGLNKQRWTVVGHGPRSALVFDDEYTRAYFIQEMAKMRILMNRPNIPSLGHEMNDVTRTLVVSQRIRESVDSMGANELKSRMQDKLPRVLFRTR